MKSLHLVSLSLLALAGAGAPVFGARPSLRVESDFDNGNAIVREIDQERRIVTIAPRAVRQARNIWWHFKLSGLTAGETVELRIVDFDPVANEVNPVYSYDQVTWHRLRDRRTPHRETFHGESVWIARNLPYPYAASLQLAERLAGRPHVEALELCQSEEGRSVKLLRFTDPAAPPADRRLVWVQARQHAFESHSSRMAEGLAEWLASDEPAAAALRRRAVVYVVPIMDVDSVAVGGAGKDQQPVDFNRCWGSEPRWHAVRAAMELIERERMRHGLVAFLDLHNPWYHETSHLHVFGTETLVQNAHAFSAEFLHAVKSLGGANTWENRFVHHDIARYDPRAQRYAARYWLADVRDGVALTFEVAHWRDAAGKDITTEGLRDFGRALGLALAGWVKP